MILNSNEISRFNPTTEAELESVEETSLEVFTYHEWDAAQIQGGTAVREAMRQAWVAVVRNVPACASRTRALNALVDARMLANAAITFKGVY